MNNKLQDTIESIIPFLLFGIAIALFIGLLILFSYVFLWGLVIGIISWAIFLVKNYFFSKTNTASKKNSRIIEHDKRD